MLKNSKNNAIFNKKLLFTAATFSLKYPRVTLSQNKHIYLIFALLFKNFHARISGVN